MNTSQSDSPASRNPLRVWPGVVIAIALILLRYIAPLVAPDAELYSTPLALIAMLGGMACAIGIIVWWLFFSRAPWVERISAVVLMIVAVFATRLVVHESIKGGMMGLMLVFYAIPIISLALVAWAVATGRFAVGLRRASLVGTILLACVPWTLVRTAGLYGGGSEFHWRWTPTPEQLLLAQANDEPKLLPPAAETAETPKDSPESKTEGEPTPTPEAATTPTPDAAASEAQANWPGFRGPNRDSIIRGVQIKTNWTASPPVEVWRRPVGPGWSSFAVRGDLLYTQEQRGDEEIVACYKVSTGEPVWRHRDPARFYESNGGAGPRATPTLSNGRVYAFGATGILNVLDAATGKVIWSRNVATDSNTKVPGWGFSSSPLIVGDVVIVAAAGKLVGYDRATGKPRWFGPAHSGSYSSPHRTTIAGIPQILLLSDDGATSVAPATGEVLWEHAWAGSTIVQPALLGGGDILISTGGTTSASRRIAVTHGTDGWSVQERWTSNGLKPNFNDFAVHKGHAYGFDGNILASINIENGKRKWKGGRYGNGQLVLLPDQDLLLVLSEEGDIALVSATPDQFTEVARFKAIEGKTWNHPALVRDLLLVRNGEQMAAFRLPLAER